MKIEIATEIQDIDRAAVIEAMARQLLASYTKEYDPDTGEEYEQSKPSKIASAMRKYLDGKIDELTESLVRDAFDAVVADRISAAVDAVLVEGWQKTDSYGSPSGPRLGLKDRINEILTKVAPDRYSNRDPMIDNLVKAAVNDLIGKQFAQEIDAARKRLRDQLDAVVTAKFAEALKSAMGLK